MESAKEKYLPPAAARACIDRLGVKPSAAEHAAGLLAGTSMATKKEQLIGEFSELLQSSGMFLHLKILRRHLKGFFQLADQLHTHAAEGTASTKQLFIINECAHCTGKRVTVVDWAHAEVRIRELRLVLRYLGAADPLIEACTGAWAQLLRQLGVEAVAEGARCELPQAPDTTATGLARVPAGEVLSREQHTLLEATAKAMMALAESASELFITGF
ncbi:unnamed protein product [Symbiodinium sp. KB8]|nr:unnamed protein product [Symbiodinium sp. KB8]